MLVSALHPLTPKNLQTAEKLEMVTRILTIFGPDRLHRRELFFDKIPDEQTNDTNESFSIFFRFFFGFFRFWLRGAARQTLWYLAGWAKPPEIPLKGCP